MSAPNRSNQLLLTEQGEAWLSQFKERDRADVRGLTEALTLVSVSEFERKLKDAIEKLASETAGPVALYTTREVPRGDLEFRQGGSGLDAVAAGSDTGSEARVAHIVRQICRTQPDKLLRQPSIEELLKHRVDRIVLVDDIVASGTRTWKYLEQLWRDPSVRSWWSYKKITFDVVAYAGTSQGVRRVRLHPSKPVVHLHRHCPTIQGLPWKPSLRRQALTLCERYAEEFHLPRHYSLGFGEVGALLVFEHSCPNNVPAIYWANTKSNRNSWQPLFVHKAVTGELGTVFPDELVAHTPISVLLNAGQERIAKALRNVIDRPLSAQMILILSLLGRGVHRREALAHATGLTAKQCSILLESCIEARLISPTLRLTDTGHAELAGLKNSPSAETRRVPALGDDVYYPNSLRVRIAG